MIGLCTVKSDRLSDSHTNCGGGRREEGAGTLFRFRHIPVPAICFRSSIPCLASSWLHWIGFGGGDTRIRIRCMHILTCNACVRFKSVTRANSMFGGGNPPPPGSKNKKYKRWIIEEENTSFLKRKVPCIRIQTGAKFSSIIVRCFFFYFFLTFFLVFLFCFVFIYKLPIMIE